MEEKPLVPPESRKLLRAIRFISITLLVLAIVFRFSNLDRKIYWHDEAYTSMVITARPGRYLTNELFQNKLVKPSDLLAFQQFVPGLNLSDMVVRKGIEDPQHPPLYYVLLRFWSQLWGTSPIVTRSFSALLSLLMFPALYWLCLELFESSLSGWVAIALFAVSPFHLVFAQEARQYGVWTAMTLASSALLLRAIRLPTWRHWILYGTSMIIAFYTALFSLWIAVGHFFYCLFTDTGTQLSIRSLKIGKCTFFCLITLVVVAFALIPWMYFLIESNRELGGTTSWSSVPLPLWITIQMTLFNFSCSFVDFDLDLNDSITYIFAVPILILQLYAVYFLCRTAPQRIWWFVLTLVGSTALAFLLPDLLFGGQRFTVIRYLIPCIVGLQLAVVYLLTTYFTASQRWKLRFATLTCSLLIGLGVLSCGVYTQANTWWNKVLNSNYHQVADLINGSDRPLIIVDSYGYNSASMISLSYLLKPDTQLLLLPPVGNSFAIQKLPASVQTIFLFNLPEVFRQQFATRYKKPLTPAFKDPWNEVWKTSL